MKKFRLIKKSIAILISLLLVLSNYTMKRYVAFGATSDNTGYKNPSNVVLQNNLLNNLKKYNKSDVKIDVNNKSNGEFFISGILSDKKSPNEKEALKFLDQNKSILGLGNVLSNFKKAKLTLDSAGYTHIKLNQYISDSPVKGRQVTVHFNNKGIITSVTGNVVPSNAAYVTALIKSSNKKITAIEAISIAKSQFNINDSITSKATPRLDSATRNIEKLLKAPATILSSEPTTNKIALVINNNVYEVYSVNIKYATPTIGNWNVYVETSSGKVIDKQSNIRYSGTPVKGTGISVDGRTKILDLDLVDGQEYHMTDLTKPMLNSNNITTLTADNGYGSYLYRYYTTTGAFTSEYGKALVDAHYNAGVVYDFYKNLFNRNSIDGEGGNIYSVAHLGYYYNNAFWDGSAMWYGDGDGSMFTYLSGDIAVVGHEMTHGVTEANGDLYCHEQSGALNESMSDVFGVLIETYDKYNVKNTGTWRFNTSDWVIGDDVYTPYIPGDALRSLANPTLYNQPDNMEDYYNVPDDDNNDNGGVHTNSGIPNKAAYLIAQSIGMEKTAKIYYDAYNYFNYTIDFKGAANAIIQSATDLYGASSAEVNAVKTAFITVKVLSAPTVLVTFNSQGGSAVTSKTAAYNSAITVPTSPIKTGYTFGGWYKEAGCINAWDFTTDKVRANITLYSKWTINNYTVAFNSQGGSAVTSKTAAYNSAITAPTSPIKTGYTFVGWYKEAGCINAWNFITNKMTTNTTLYAKWTVIAPGNPKSLKAVSSSYNSINISWSKVTGASGYEVYRSTSAAGANTLRYDTTTVNYNSTGLTTNSIFYYKVRAYRMVGTVKVYGAFSSVISARPIPATPTSVKAVSSSYNSIKVSWNAVIGASGYEVYRTTSAAGANTLRYAMTASSYNSTGLTTNSTYYYKV